MHLISGTHNDSIGQMVAGHFTHNTGYEVHAPFTAMGWVKDGQLIGQAIFVDYTGSSIEIHIYGPGAMHIRSIRDAFKYVFVQLGCNRLTAKPYTTNKKVINLIERLGFVYEGTLKEYYPPKEQPIDAYIYRLPRHIGLKWLNNAKSPESASSS
jgi:RimJ/RimL family protein N-acetyltransferase